MALKASRKIVDERSLKLVYAASRHVVAINRFSGLSFNI